MILRCLAKRVTATTPLLPTPPTLRPLLTPPFPLTNFRSFTSSNNNSNKGGKKNDDQHRGPAKTSLFQKKPSSSTSSSSSTSTSEPTK